MAADKLYRDASNRLCFELFHISAADYSAVCEAIIAAFQLSPEVASFGAGTDAIAMDYRRADQTVELAWDNWSGLIVTAKTTDSERLLNDIANWLASSIWAVSLTD